MSFQKIMSHPESFTQKLLKDDLHKELNELSIMTPYKCLQKGFLKKLNTKTPNYYGRKNLKGYPSETFQQHILKNNIHREIITVTHMNPPFWYNRYYSEKEWDFGSQKLFIQGIPIYSYTSAIPTEGTNDIINNHYSCLGLGRGDTLEFIFDSAMIYKKNMQKEFNTEINLPNEMIQWINLSGNNFTRKWKESDGSIQEGKPLWKAYLNGPISNMPDNNSPPPRNPKGLIQCNRHRRKLLKVLFRSMMDDEEYLIRQNEEMILLP